MHDLSLRAFLERCDRLWKWHLKSWLEISLLILISSFLDGHYWFIESSSINSFWTDLGVTHPLTAPSSFDKQWNRYIWIWIWCLHWFLLFYSVQAHEQHCSKLPSVGWIHISLISFLCATWYLRYCCIIIYFFIYGCCINRPILGAEKNKHWKRRL